MRSLTFKVNLVEEGWAAFETAVLDPKMAPPEARKALKAAFSKALTT